MDESRIKMSATRIVDARKRMRDYVSKKNHQHVCSKQECFPMSERHCIMDGYLALPIVCEPVFVCRYGNIHICTTNLCRRYFEALNGTCSISGIQYRAALQTDYDKEDARTWYVKPKTTTLDNKDQQMVKPKKKDRAKLTSSASLFKTKTKRVQVEQAEDEKEEYVVKTVQKRQRVVKDDALRSKIEKILQNILFSPIRKQFNEEIEAEHKHDHERELNRYMMQCKQNGQFPNLIDLYAINTHYGNMPLPMVNIKMDHTMRKHYTVVIAQIWKNVCKYAEDNGAKINVEAVTLGALYTMRQGLNFDNMTVIPKDPFLSRLGVLPLINDIVRFGYSKKKVTSGEKLIDASYNRAMQLNVSKKKLSLDYNELDEYDSDETIFIPLKKKKE